MGPWYAFCVKRSCLNCTMFVMLCSPGENPPRYFLCLRCWWTSRSLSSKEQWKCTAWALKAIYSTSPEVSFLALSSIDVSFYFFPRKRAEILYSRIGGELLEHFHGWALYSRQILWKCSQHIATVRLMPRTSPYAPDVSVWWMTWLSGCSRPMFLLESAIVNLPLSG